MSGHSRVVSTPGETPATKWPPRGRRHKKTEVGLKRVRSCSVWAGDFSYSSEIGENRIDPWPRSRCKKTGTDCRGAVCPALSVPFSRETNLPAYFT